MSEVLSLDQKIAVRKAAKAIARHHMKANGGNYKDKEAFKAYWANNKSYFVRMSRIARRGYLQSS